MASVQLRTDFQCQGSNFDFGSVAKPIYLTYFGHLINYFLKPNNNFKVFTILSQKL